MTNITLIGLPTDINSSFERGPAAGPSAIRAALFSDRGNMASEYGLEIGKDIVVDDKGDLPLTEDTPHDDGLIRAAIAEALTSGSIPTWLIGTSKTSCSLPTLKPSNAWV